MTSRKSSLEEFMDDLQAIYVRVLWWVPWVVASFLALLVMINVPADPPIWRQVSILGIFVVFVLPGIAAQLAKGKRRRLLDNNRDLDRIRALSWREFEELIAEAYRRHGYTVDVVGGGGADGGVDVVLRRDGKNTYVQAKHWKRDVGVKVVRELLGVMVAKMAASGIVVTSGRFTKEAKDFAAGAPIELVDGEGLVALTSGVQPSPRPQPRQEPQVLIADPQTQVQNDHPEIEPCPVCSSPMVRRVAKRGAKAGEEFYGCSRFPKCRGTRPIVETI